MNASTDDVRRPILALASERTGELTPDWMTIILMGDESATPVWEYGAASFRAHFGTLKALDYLVIRQAIHLMIAEGLLALGTRPETILRVFITGTGDADRKRLGAGE